MHSVRGRQSQPSTGCVLSKWRLIMNFRPWTSLGLPKNACSVGYQQYCEYPNDGLPSDILYKQFVYIIAVISIRYSYIVHKVNSSWMSSPLSSPHDSASIDAPTFAPQVPSQLRVHSTYSSASLLLKGTFLLEKSQKSTQKRRPQDLPLWLSWQINGWLNPWIHGEQRRAVLAQWWEHLAPTNVARDWFPDSTSYLRWVCWFYTLLREGFPLSSKTNICRRSSVG